MFENRIFQRRQWRLIFEWTPRYCGTEIGGFDLLAKILFEIKIDVDNRVDSFVTVLTN